MLGQLVHQYIQMLGQLVHQYIHSKCSYPRQTISSLNARSGCSSIRPLQVLGQVVHL